MRQRNDMKNNTPHSKNKFMNKISKRETTLKEVVIKSVPSNSRHRISEAETCKEIVIEPVVNEP